MRCNKRVRCCASAIATRRSMVAVDCVRSVVVCIISMLIFSAGQQIADVPDQSLSVYGDNRQGHGHRLGRVGPHRGDQAVRAACTHARQTRAVRTVDGHAAPDRRVTGDRLRVSRARSSARSSPADPRRRPGSPASATISSGVLLRRGGAAAGGGTARSPARCRRRRARFVV